MPMFGQFTETPYDLRFSIFGIPVRVHPMFWLIAALMGWVEGRPDLIVVWIACVFISIFIHELGHAVTAKAFGWPPEILLYHFGGLASFHPGSGYTSAKSIAISFAGPGAGFVFYVFVRALREWLLRTGTNPGELAIFAIYQLEWINLWWGLINLLPVLPLDGGQICREVCMSWRLRYGLEWALKISIAVSGLVAFYFFSNHDQYGLYPGLLFGALCFHNVQTYQSDRGYW